MTFQALFTTRARFGSTRQLHRGQDFVQVAVDEIEARKLGNICSVLLVDTALTVGLDAAVVGLVDRRHLRAEKGSCRPFVHPQHTWRSVAAVASAMNTNPKCTRRLQDLAEPSHGLVH